MVAFIPSVGVELYRYPKKFSVQNPSLTSLISSANADYMAQDHVFGSNALRKYGL